MSSPNPSKMHYTGTGRRWQSRAPRLDVIAQAIMMFLVVLGLSSCGVNKLTSRKANPVLQENIGQHMLATISTTASHRTAYIRNRINPPDERVILAANPVGPVRISTNISADRLGVGRHGQICPEPPPDVGQAVASSLAAALTGNVSAAPGQALGNVGEAAVGTAFERAFSTSITPLLRRSQGLQYHRDAIFYLCIAYINEFGGMGGNGNEDTRNRNPGQDGNDAKDFWGAWNLIQSNALQMLKSENEHPSPTIFVTINPNQADGKDGTAQKLIEALNEALGKLQTANSSDDQKKE